MCGIFSLLINEGASNNSIKEYTDFLFIQTEPRGRQASGLSIKSNVDLRFFKSPMRAKQFIKEKKYHDLFKKDIEYSSFLGHCRLVTDGTPIFNKNNQPIIKDKFNIIHNGVINNSQSLKQKYSIASHLDSDTDILAEILSIKSCSMPLLDALNQTLDEIIGSYSLIIQLNDSNSIIFISNFGSLYYQKINNDIFLITSESTTIKKFGKRFNFSVAPLKTESKKVYIIDNKTLEFSDSISTISAPTPIKLINRSPQTLKKCTKCILPETYPFIRFDKDGVCNFCHKYKVQKYKGKIELEKTLSKYRKSNGEYDCLLGLSGGRDSSYALHILKEEFGMKPLGFVYDWLLTSQKARHNIAKMAGALDTEVIYRCGDYERQAKNIRKNINGFLKDPDLGMLTFVQAGDKEMYHYGRKIREENNLELTVWGSGFQLEQREFFVGYCGIDKTLVNNPRLYNYGWFTKLQLALFYSKKIIKNPYLWNRSIIDNAAAFWHCFVAKDDFLYLFEYYPWEEDKMEALLKEKYNWEVDSQYGENQWRMDDFHTAFNNYVYYTIGGFSEFDDFRSNQIREGILTRDEALKLAAKDNTVKFENLLQFSQLIGFNLEHVLTKIEAVPKLY